MHGVLCTKLFPDDPHWSADGQFVVIHPEFVLTAAHVLFYKVSDQSQDNQQKHAQLRVPVEHGRSLMHSVRATFFKPRLNNLQARQAYHVYLTPVRFSGRMDAALLRITHKPADFTPLPVPNIARTITINVRVSLVVYSRNSHQRSSELLMEELGGRVTSVVSVIMTKDDDVDQAIPKGSYQLARASYSTENGFSGGAVFHRTETGQWELYGFHISADSLDYNQVGTLNALQAPKKRARVNLPATDSNIDVKQETESPRRNSSSTSSTNSYPASSSSSNSDSEGDVDVSAKEAIVHAQANPARATFVGAYSVLQSENWDPSKLTSSDAPILSGSSSNSSPPRESNSTGQTLRNDPSLFLNILPLPLYDFEE